MKIEKNFLKIFKRVCDMIVQEYLIEDKNVIQMSLKYGIDKNIIQTILKAGRVRYIRVSKRKLSEEQISEIVQKYQNGTTLQILAKKYRYTPRSVSLMLKNSGANVRRSGPSHRKIPTSQFPVIISLRHQGLSMREIAAKYHVSYQCISNILNHITGIL